MDANLKLFLTVRAELVEAGARGFDKLSPNGLGLSERLCAQAGITKPVENS